MIDELESEEDTPNKIEKSSPLEYNYNLPFRSKKSVGNSFKAPFKMSFPSTIPDNNNTPNLDEDNDDN